MNPGAKPLGQVKAVVENVRCDVRVTCWCGVEFVELEVKDGDPRRASCPGCGTPMQFNGSSTSTIKQEYVAEFSS